MNKKKLLLVGGIIVAIIVIIIVSIKLNSKDNKSNSSVKNSNNSFRSININEDLAIDGYVENVENVRWNNANIVQRDNKMSVMINLNNESDINEVPERDLTITLYNKSGKKIASKETHMDAISANYGYTFLNVDFEVEEIEIVYDIKIVAK